MHVLVNFTASQRPLMYTRSPCMETGLEFEFQWHQVYTVVACSCSWVKPLGMQMFFSWIAVPRSETSDSRVQYLDLDMGSTKR